MLKFPEGIIPEGFGEPNHGDAATKVVIVHRECASNARNYGATHALIHLIADHHGQPWLIYLHNGKAFDSDQEVIDKGIMPLVSDNQGGALNGVGLLTCAGMLSFSDQRLVVGSKRPDRTWFFGTGRQDASRGRTWTTSDATEEFEALTSQLLGSVRDRYNVFYAFRIDLPTARNYRKNLLAPDLAILTAIASGSIYESGLITEYGEKMIDPNHENPKYRSLDAYRNAQDEIEDIEESEEIEDQADSSKGKKRTNGGSTRRVIVPLSEYNDRYALDNGRFSFESDPFEFVISYETNRRAVGVRARITIQLYANQEKNGWIPNQRNGITAVGRAAGKTIQDLRAFEQECASNPNKKPPAGYFKKGSHSAPGSRPPKTAFLRIPCVATHSGLSLENRRALQRFADNAVWFFSAGSVLSQLGLPYSEDGKVFAIVNLDIIEIKGFSDGEHESPQTLKPIILLQNIGQRPDFTIRQKFAEEIIDAAVEALRPKVPLSVIERFEQEFPSNLQDCVPLGADADQPHIAKETSPRFKVFNLFDDANTFHTIDRINGGNLSLGQNVAVAIYDEQEKTFVKHGEISWRTGYTRGIDQPTCGKALVNHFPEVEESVEKLRAKFSLTAEDDLPIITFRIPREIVTPNEDGSLRVTPPNQYVRGISLPSKAVRATCRYSPINFGSIREVPARESENEPNPASKKEGGSLRDNQGPGTNNLRHTRSFHHYRDERIFCTYVGGKTQDMFKINPNNEIIRAYYMQHDTFGTKSTKLCNDLFIMMWSVARGIYRSLKATEGVESHISTPTGEDQPEWDSGLDYHINRAIGQLLTDCEVVKNMLKEIRDFRAKQAQRRTVLVEQAA